MGERERETERERKGERGREREGGREGERKAKQVKEEHISSIAIKNLFNLLKCSFVVLRVEEV